MALKTEGNEAISVYCTYCHARSFRIFLFYQYIADSIPLLYRIQKQGGFLFCNEACCLSTDLLES